MFSSDINEFFFKDISLSSILFQFNFYLLLLKNNMFFYYIIIIIINLHIFCEIFNYIYIGECYILFKHVTNKA